jgi:hypothetical protein
MNSLCLAFNPVFRGTEGYITINMIANGFLLADMLVIFRTSNLNIDTGEEIYDPKILALSYIISYHFWIDLLCVIPFELFAKYDLLILFSMLKISRVGRIRKIIHNMNTVSKTKTVSPAPFLNIFRSLNSLTCCSC